MADDKVKVVIGFDPENPSRQGKTESLDPAVAHQLVNDGRAQYADQVEDAPKGKKGDPNNNAGA